MTKRIVGILQNAHRFLSTTHKDHSLPETFSSFYFYFHIHFPSLVPPLFGHEKCHDQATQFNQSSFFTFLQRPEGLTRGTAGQEPSLTLTFASLC